MPACLPIHPMEAREGSYAGRLGKEYEKYISNRPLKSYVPVRCWQQPSRVDVRKEWVRKWRLPAKFEFACITVTGLRPAHCLQITSVSLSACRFSCVSRSWESPRSDMHSVKPCSYRCWNFSGCNSALTCGWHDTPMSILATFTHLLMRLDVVQSLVMSCFPSFLWAHDNRLSLLRPAQFIGA